MKLRNLTWLAVAFGLAACDSPLNTDPTASIDSDQALTNARGIELAVNGAYSSLQTEAIYDRDLLVFPEMYADNMEFTGTYTSDGEVANRNIFPSNSAIINAWRAMYRGINRTNEIIAAVDGIEDLTADKRDQYLGEAYFIRALHYFNLTRYFGGVPLVLEPSRGVGEDAYPARAAQSAVFAQIESDLENAIGLLPASTDTKARVSSHAARALLARVYLEQHKWADAADAANEVIEDGPYQLLDEYRSVFASKDHSEAIFELRYTTNNSNSLAYWHFPNELGGRRGFAPSPSVYAAYEPGDERRDASIAEDPDEGLYGIKYFRISNGDDNVHVIRLAEMYLIRAEANAMLGAAPETVRADINVIRNRAGLADLPATVTAQDDLIDAILQERRLEFLMEGHRFFDLRRTGRAEEVLDIDATRLLFPIPQAELDVNDNLEQNSGY